MVLPDITDAPLDSSVETEPQQLAPSPEQHLLPGLAPDGAEDVVPTETELSPEPPAEPSPEPQPAPEPDVVSDEAARLREENVRLTRAAEEHQRQAEEATLVNQAAEYAAQETARQVQRGMDQDTARYIGQLDGASRYWATKAQQAELRATRVTLAYQYGVPQEQLAGFQDEVSMRHYAEQYQNTTGPQATKVTALEKELAELRTMVNRSRVPAQPYNQPGGTSAVRLTADNIDQLWMDGHVTDARYREFLNTGR